MKSPLLSIVIPTYNSEFLLDKTLSSIESQGISKSICQVIIVDGKSKDNTLSIVEKYKHIISNVIVESDDGIYDAMNKGIDVALGKFIYFIGAGDILIKNCLAIVLPLLSNTSDLYYGNVLRTKSLKIYDGKFTTLKLFRRNICHQAIFYPLCEIVKFKYNLKYKILADYNLNLLLFSNARIKKNYLDVTVALYDDASDGVSMVVRDDVFYEDLPNIIKYNFSPYHRFIFSAFKFKRLLKRWIT